MDARRPLEMAKLSTEDDREVLFHTRAYFRKQCAILSLLAAGRRDAASALEAEAVRLDPGKRMKSAPLVETRAAAGIPRSE